MVEYVVIPMTDDTPERFRGMADDSDKIVPALEDAFEDTDGARVAFGTRKITVEFDHDHYNSIHITDVDDGFGFVDWPVPVEVASIHVDPDQGFTSVKLESVT